MEIQNYFDNAATTPADPRVIAEMHPYLTSSWGNANSIHAMGQAARMAVETAQERVARLLGAEDPSQILFTSGATESNNWIAANFPKLAISPFEHSAMLEPARRKQARVVRNEGLRLYPLGEKVDLLSVMSVNNEIGSMLHLPTDARADAHFIHRDITQSVGKIPTNVDTLDFASFSGHKFYGPKGVGGLYAKDPTSLQPFILGGEQQHRLRGGTLNVPGIVGMGTAALIALEQMEEDGERVRGLRQAVLERLQGTPDFRVNGSPEVSPYILSLSFLGIEGESLVIELDRAGFAISSGAACSARSTDPSHVLVALKVPAEWLRGTIRVSFGRFNTLEAAHALGSAIAGAVSSLRNLRRI